MNEEQIITNFRSACCKGDLDEIMLQYERYKGIITSYNYQKGFRSFIIDVYENKHYDIVEFMIKNKYFHNDIYDEEGKNLSLRLYRNKNYHLLRLMKEYTLCLNIPADKNTGKTVLQIVCDDEDVETVKFLVEIVDVYNSIDSLDGIKNKEIRDILKPLYFDSYDNQTIECIINHLKRISIKNNKLSLNETCNNSSLRYITEFFDQFSFIKKYFERIKDNEVCITDEIIRRSYHYKLREFLISFINNLRHIQCDMLKDLIEIFDYYLFGDDDILEYLTSFKERLSKIMMEKLNIKYFDGKSQIFINDKLIQESNSFEKENYEKYHHCENYYQLGEYHIKLNNIHKILFHKSIEDNLNSIKYIPLYVISNCLEYLYKRDFACAYEQSL